MEEVNKFTAQGYEQYKRCLETGYAEAYAEAYAEGYAEGCAEIIAQLLAAGIPAEVIADALDITVEECLSYRQ